MYRFRIITLTVILFLVLFAGSFFGFRFLSYVHYRTSLTTLLTEERTSLSLATPFPRTSSPIQTPAASSTSSNTATSSISQDNLPLTPSPATNIKPATENISLPPQFSRIPSNILYRQTSQYVVNLLCMGKNSYIVVATGVIIHQDGYILTNAHVAEDALQDTCTVRIGSPAKTFGVAEKIFSPRMFSATSSATENLKRDISLWRITETLPDSPLTAPFPFVEIHPNHATTIGDALGTFSYPAEFLSFQVINNDLYLSFSETIVEATDRHFIQSSLGLASQKGSSGGILIDEYTGEIAGLIFAVSDTDNASNDISKRKLYTLTPFAIDETILEETGKHLQEYLATKP